VVGGLVVAVAEVGLAGVRFFWPNRTEAFGGLIVAATWDTLPPVGGPPLRNQAGRFYLMRNEEGLLAFSWKCTHLGCTVPWNSAEGQFHCPCHESQFNRRGELVDGPAPRPLDLMPITVQGDSIIVDTGTIIRRSSYDPRQVTPIR
jgi:cytochrome b6-f complex iron-sulfur subunit